MFKLDLPRYERIWLIVGTGTLAVFLVLFGFMAFSMGLTLSDGHKTVTPEALQTTAPFDQPGFVEIGPKEYKATMIAQAFSFVPGEAVIPVGSKIHFEVTSPDVVHGIGIPGTNVNMMVLPGHITEATYTFNRPGEYLILCNEYCGAGHHVMMGKLIVK